METTDVFKPDQVQKWIIDILKLISESNKATEIYKYLKSENTSLAKYFEKGDGSFENSYMTKFSKGDRYLQEDEISLFIDFIIQKVENSPKLKDNLKDKLKDNISKAYINKYRKKTFYSSNKDFFYKSLFTKLFQRINSAKHDNFDIKSFFSQRFLVEDKIVEFLISNPSAFFSIIEEGYSISSETEKKGNATQFKYFDESFKKGDKISLQNIDRAVLGQTPSPFGDSLALFLELGRFKRLCELLNLKSEIVLIGENWVKLNNVVSKLNDSEPKTDHLIDLSIEFRKKLYERLNINYQIKRIKMVENESKKDILNISKEYDCFKNRIESELYEDFSIKDLFRIYNVEDAPIKLKRCFKEDALLGLTIIEKKRNLKFLHSIYNHFSENINEDVISYILLQRYLQHGWKNRLKIGVRSELMFDVAFYELNKLENYDTPMYAVYFDHYFFQKDGNEYLDLIPYYFPSGTIFKKYSKEEKNISVFEQHAIMLNDYKDSNKITDLLNQIPRQQLAIQFSDLLSFASYYFEGTLKEKMIYEILNDTHSEFAESWKLYNTNFHHEINKLKKYIFTPWYDNTNLPYYFYPYILSTEFYWSEYRKKLINAYKRLIELVLEDVYSLQKVN